MTQVACDKTLTPEERSYLLKIVTEHLQYYRILAGSTKVTEQTLGKLALLEALRTKLL